MTIRFIGALLCGGLFIFAVPAYAVQGDPIPGVDVSIEQTPSGAMIKAGACKNNGGSVVKQGTKWVCAGLPAQQQTPNKRAN